MPQNDVDPHPRAGWEPDTPESDSFLRRFLVNWTASIEAHGRPLGGRVLRRDDLAAVDAGRPAGGENTATLLAPLFPDRLAEVTAALDDFIESRRGIQPARSTCSAPGLRPISAPPAGRRWITRR